MKKEELLDLITEFKPDDAFVEEALGEREDAPVKVYAGNYKRSPLKIIAPIAACLAVVIGTGAVVSRLNKPEQSENSEQQSAELTVDPNAFIQVDFEGKDLKEIYNSNIIELNFEPEEIDRDFIAECISMIKNENEAALQDGISWQVVRQEFLCSDGWDRDYLILPKIDGHAVADVGARVFHRTRGYSSIRGETFDVKDHGGFGKGYENLDLDYVVDDWETPLYYYCVETIGSAKSESIRHLTLDKNDEIDEDIFMEKITDGDAVTYITYSPNRKKIGEEEFIGIWNTYAFVPKFYTEFTTEEFDECREALKEELGIPESRKVLWRDAEIDIDLDGTKELLLSLSECEDFKGVYVYARTSSGIKQVGSFDTEGGFCKPEEILYFDGSGDESFPYFLYSSTIIPEDDSWKGSMWRVEKILVDEDGNITTETILEEGTKSFDRKNRVFTSYYKLNGEEISHEEYRKEWKKYWNYYHDHEYHKFTVPTDPDNYAWD